MIQAYFEIFEKKKPKNKEQQIWFIIDRLGSYLFKVKQ